MAQRILRNALKSRFYSTQAKPAVEKVGPSPVEVSKAANGINLATQENGSGLARIVCAVKAGCRFENTSQRGVAHGIRVSSDNTQREARAFGMTRDLQQMGGRISCTTTRENILYTLEVPRNEVQYALPYFYGMVVGQSFRPWEIADSLSKIDVELLQLSECPDRELMETVHNVAYRGETLGRSLYCPRFMMSEVSSQMEEYTKSYYTPDRMSLSAINVPMSQLNSVAAHFGSNSSQGGASAAAAKFYAGERRDETAELLAYATLCGEGASVSGSDFWAFAVLEQVLAAPSNISWSSNTTSSLLNRAVAPKTDLPFCVTSFNASYSDSGLFGINIVTVPENSDLVIRNVAEQLRGAGSASLTEALPGAKQRVKSSVAFSSEVWAQQVDCRALELNACGSLSNPADVMKAIDAVTQADVQNAAKKMVSKLSMVSRGEICNVPYLDSL